MSWKCTTNYIKRPSPFPKHSLSYVTSEILSYCSRAISWTDVIHPFLLRLNCTTHAAERLAVES